MDAAFWGGLVAVIGVNLVLAGDNAVVIALAARNLPVELQRRALIYGAVLAVALRIVLTAAVVALLQIPALKLVGGIVLLRVAWQLALDEHEPDDVASAHDLRSAIVTIVVADVVMSLDNVLAVAAAARGNYLLIVIGLLISIPIVMGGASLLLRVIKRFPITVWIGALLIAFTAFELILGDEIVHGWVDEVITSGWVHRGVSGAGGILVIASAYFRQRHSKTKALLKIEGSRADD